MSHRSVRSAIVVLLTALITPVHAFAALDRPPKLLEHRQVGDSIRLLWAPGGNEDGILDPSVEWYAVQRKDEPWWTSFNTRCGGDEHTMSCVDTLGTLSAWTTTQPVTYRIVAVSGSTQTYSDEVSFVPALPLYPPSEVLDGKVRLTWMPARGQDPATKPLGYRVQKRASLGWVDAHVGLLQEEAFVDPNTTLGTSHYRVQAVLPALDLAAPNPVILTSNEQEIVINPQCAGQAVDATLPPLAVVEATDRDADGDHDGTDIVAALQECDAKTYERIGDGIGDDDGVCEMGDACVTGGCVLRALPETYDNVAIRITEQPYFCSYSNWPLGQPSHCLSNLDFPAGLVIEGYGAETVLRSPVPYASAPILEVHRKNFQLTLRNLVLDGRKHEQVFAGGWHAGLRVWNQSPWADTLREIHGDSIGADDPNDPTCNGEVCVENPAGTGDGDGRCEPHEDCVEDSNGNGIFDVGESSSCETDSWPNAIGCESVPELHNDDGCIDNVDVRNMSHYGVHLEGTDRWIVEDSEFHDIGCVNRGYGFDCPQSIRADSGPLPGYKMDGYGLHVGFDSSELQVRRNDVYRTVKYGLSFKNGGAESCSGLLRNNEISYNKLHDLGGVGIYNHGSIGARIHHNTISNTTTYNEPADMNNHYNSFAMSLGGVCTDDNEFSDNTISGAAGIAIQWDGDAEILTCNTSGSCAPIVPAGNRIANNTVDGACVEKDAVTSSYAYYYGAIEVHYGASGPLLLDDNTLSDSLCRSVISVENPDAGIGSLDLWIAGGSFESGPAGTAGQSHYCGALQVRGDNRTVSIGDGARVTNTGASTVPKGCVKHDGTIVVRDVPIDPFSPDPFGAFQNFGGTVVECSSNPTHPDCL